MKVFWFNEGPVVKIKCTSFSVVFRYVRDTFGGPATKVIASSCSSQMASCIERRLSVCWRSQKRVYLH